MAWGPLYEECSVFTAVLTPHFRQQCSQRTALLPVNWWANEHLEKIWDIGPMNDTFGFKVGRAYIYARKQYNDERQRLELELITMTPGDKFHTEDKKFAKLVKF